ncbi:MAG: response regulator [Anaerolineae bacterium]|nr:response regulator [Anaerolineae bacterium]
MATWMVVEDEPDIYDVLLAMFELWGIEGVAFVDGGEAVAWIDSVDRGEVVGDLPELAILDIRLPEVSGPEIGARLRQSERLRSIAVVLVTAYRLKPEDEAAARAKADADLLLYKPLPPMPEFRKMLDTIIDRRKQIAATQKVAATATAAVATTTPPTAPSLPAKVSEPAAQPVETKVEAQEVKDGKTAAAKPVAEPVSKTADTKPSTPVPSKPTPAPAAPASTSSSSSSSAKTATPPVKPPTTGMLKPGNPPTTGSPKVTPEAKPVPPASTKPTPPNSGSGSSSSKPPKSNP